MSTQEDLVVMRNVVMSPWPTDGNFIARLIGEFKKVLNEEVQVRSTPNFPANSMLTCRSGLP